MKRPSLRNHFHEGVLHLTLDNQEHGNSFGATEAQELSRVLKFHKKKTRILVFQSAHPRLFCSGGNLKKYARLNRLQGIKANREIRKTLKLLAAFPSPKLGVVEGDCFGGGIELLSCMNEVWCLPHVLFGFWQRRMALSLGWGGETRLLGRMKSSELLRLSITAETFSAERAQKYGLVDRIVSRNSLPFELQSYLVRELQMPTAPVNLILKGFETYKESDFNRLWLNPEHKRRLQNS